MSFDPYAASYVSQQPVAQASLAVDPEAIRMLQMTRPWVRFCSVIGFIGTGFMILGGLAMLVSGAIVGASGKATTTLPFAGFNVVIGLVYLVMAVLYIFPSIKLWSYGSAITSLMTTGASADLVRALDLQRSFWKFVGIMVCLMIAIYGLIIVGLMIAAVASASHH